MTRSSDEAEDRRVLERRWQDRMETRVGDTENRVGKLEVRVEMLTSTVNSRHDALEGGQRELSTKIDALESIKDRLLGAYALVMFLGVSGIVAMIVAIVKLAKVP